MKFTGFILISYSGECNLPMQRNIVLKIVYIQINIFLFSVCDDRVTPDVDLPYKGK